MTWQSVIPIIFFACILIQSFYLLFVFTSLLKHVDFDLAEDAEQLPPVSIIIAAWNELHNLKELLPILDAQDYPQFEIIVVDDRSEDGTYDYLLQNEGGFKNVSFVRVKALPEHFTAKKYALTLGIKKAKYEELLFTDADCRPVGHHWVKSMMSQKMTDTDLVLGFSPYDEKPGLLNAFIRYETFQTALQYLSFAAFGIPFMGVGRNLQYRKSTFLSAKGFASHNTLLSGDDDLFVNQVGNKYNTDIRIDADSHVYSEPKASFEAWVNQKRRHLSVGKVYKFRDRVTLGLLWLSFIGAWLLSVPTFFIELPGFKLPDWLIVSNDILLEYGVQHWQPYTNWMKVVTLTFFGWVFLRWLILHLVNKKLNSTIRSKNIIFHDFLYFGYLLIFGLVTLFSNPKKIKWR